MRYALTLSLLSALVLVGRGRADEAAGPTIIRGVVTSVKPGTDQFTVKTADGKEETFRTDARTVFEGNRQPGGLGRLKTGTRVKVQYVTRDGVRHVATVKRLPATAEDVQRETREALRAAKSYSFQQKDEYEKKLRGVLHDLHDRIDELKEQAKAAGGKASREMDKKIQVLRKQEVVVRRQLRNVRSATADTWDKVKRGMNTAVKDLQKLYEDVRAQFQH